MPNYKVIMNSQEEDDEEENSSFDITFHNKSASLSASS